MKFLLNTSIDPHFCALFDTQNILVDKQEWTIKKADGIKVFEFFEKHKFQNIPFTLIGGVSGPGGFSSLRVSAGILNSLSYAKKRPIHQARADLWISEFLKPNNHPPEHFLLNSFSDGVFYKEKNSNTLNRITIIEASEQFKNTPLFIAHLPPEKREHIKKQINLRFKNAENTLLKVLIQSPPQKIYIPDYEYPPVINNTK